MPLTIDRLLQPLAFSEFHNVYYEKKPLLIKRQSPEYYEDLLTLAEVNEYLEETHLSSDALRIARDGKELSPRDFTYSKFSINNRGDSVTVDKDLVFARFYDGYSIIITQYGSSPMLRLRHALERTFHASANANIFITPRNAQGFVPHWDREESFILQFSGTKDWLVYDSPIILPTQRQAPYEGEWTRVEPTLTATLEPGDLLYLPRGFMHEARSRDEVSGHITFSVCPATYGDLLWSIADNVDVDPWLRKSLPADFQSVISDGEFLRHVQRFFENADLPAYLDRIHGKFVDDLVTDTKNRMTDYLTLPAIDRDSRFRTRSVVYPELTNGGEHAVLTFHRKSLEFPAAAAESIRCMIDAGEFTVSALPGNCEDNLALCSKLVQEGFLGIA